MNINDAVLVLTANVSPPPAFFADFRIEDKGQGPGLSYWNPRLGPQPTADQLAAITDDQVATFYSGRALARAQAILADPGTRGKAIGKLSNSTHFGAADVAAMLLLLGQG